MFSPLKVALFAFISFATLALAIPYPADQPKDPRVAISNCNNALDIAVDPLSPFYLPFYTLLCSRSLPLLRVYYRR